MRSGPCCWSQVVLLIARVMREQPIAVHHGRVPHQGRGTHLSDFHDGRRRESRSFQLREQASLQQERHTPPSQPPALQSTQHLPLPSHSWLWHSSTYSDGSRITSTIAVARVFACHGAIIWRAARSAGGVALCARLKSVDSNPYRTLPCLHLCHSLQPPPPPPPPQADANVTHEQFESDTVSHLLGEQMECAFEVDLAAWQATFGHAVHHPPRNHVRPFRPIKPAEAVSLACQPPARLSCQPHSRLDLSTGALHGRERGSLAAIQRERDRPLRQVLSRPARNYWQRL